MPKRSHILSALVLLLLAAVAAPGRDDWRTAIPIIYNIEYGDNHVGSSEYLKKIQDAPPQLLHVGEDVAFSSVYGTKDGYAGAHLDSSPILGVFGSSNAMNHNPTRAKAP